MRVFLPLVFIILFFRSVGAQDTNSVPVIFKYSLDSEIVPSSLRATQRAFDMARERNATAILIEMNTYGGLLHIADSIRTKIIRSDIPVYVFINNNAASAGALISIACDKIYMSRGSNIGAATVVDQGGDVLPDKYQSYMRGLIRSTAEEKGRDPNIAQGMVDPDIEIEGVTEKGKVITFTREEAIRHGFCDGAAESVSEVLRLEGYTDYKLEVLQLTWIDHVINLLTSPFISGILIMLIIGGIYFELQTPGVGFPLMAAVIAAILYFMPLYLEQLATHFEIALFIAGVILILVEVFVLPGFGIAGLAGIILMITGLSLSLVYNFYFDFTFAGTGNIIRALVTVISSFVMAVLLMILAGKRFTRWDKFQRLVLNTTLASKESYSHIISHKETLVGKKGVAATDLRPGGKALIENEMYDVVSEGGFIKKDSPVEVVLDYQIRIVVREVE